MRVSTEVYTIWHEKGEETNLDSDEEDEFEGEGIDILTILDNIASYMNFMTPIESEVGENTCKGDNNDLQQNEARLNMDASKFYISRFR